MCERGTSAQPNQNSCTSSHSNLVLFLVRAHQNSQYVVRRDLIMNLLLSPQGQFQRLFHNSPLSRRVFIDEALPQVLESTIARPLNMYA